MSSPFSPEEKNLILAGVGFFVLMSCWQALKAVRDRLRTGKPLRLAPLVIALLWLVTAVEVVMVVNVDPLFTQHPLRMLSIPVIGLLLVVVTSIYDRRRAPPPEKPPARYYLFKNRVDSSAEITRVALSDGTLLGHLKAMAHFYLGTLEINLTSRYGLEETLARIRDLNKARAVYVSEKAPNKLTVCATSARRHTQPLFTGTLNVRDGKVTLEGRMELDSGIAAFLVMFGLILLVLSLGSLFTSKTGSDWFGALLAPFVFLLLLEFGYRISKGSPEIVVSNLERALRG